MLCLQETWLNEDNKISFKNFKVFGKDRDNNRMGGSVS